MSPKPIIITDPRDVPTAAGPMIVSKGGGTDIYSRLTRWRTKSWCEHSMLFLEQGKFVWEAPSIFPPWGFYNEGPMDRYMVPNVCLKFYQLIEITPAATSALAAYVAKRIAAPWPYKVYDWAGIAGEAIGFPKIHTPGLEYCSVDAIHALHTIAPLIPIYSSVVLDNIPSEENPGYLDATMVTYQKVFRLYGIYQYGALKPS